MSMNQFEDEIPRRFVFREELESKQWWNRKWPSVYWYEGESFLKLTLQLLLFVNTWKKKNKKGISDLWKEGVFSPSLNNGLQVRYSTLVFKLAITKKISVHIVPLLLPSFRQNLNYICHQNHSLSKTNRCSVLLIIIAHSFLLFFRSFILILVVFMSFIFICSFCNKDKGE